MLIVNSNNKNKTRCLKIQRVLCVSNKKACKIIKKKGKTSVKTNSILVLANFIDRKSGKVVDHKKNEDNELKLFFLI